MNRPVNNPTCTNTALITASAVRGVQAIYRPGYRYATAGVMLLDMQAGTIEQGELDLGRDEVDAPKRAGLMTALDRLDERFGRGAVGMSSAGLAGDGESRRWVTKQEFKTPDYTTRWGELPMAGA